ncbi:MAG: hypothetical protein IPK64_17665 [bacterium]|nr:hypothetical protein [bacterium]
MPRELPRIPLWTAPVRLLVPILALAAAVCPAAAQPTTSFSDLPCAVFLDLPAPAGSGTPFLPFTVPLCGGGQVNVATRRHPLRPAPFTDDPFYTGTFTFSSPSSLLKEPSTLRSTPATSTVATSPAEPWAGICCSTSTCRSRRLA